MKIETLVDVIGVTFGEFGKGYTCVQAVLELLETIAVNDISVDDPVFKDFVKDSPDKKTPENSEGY